MNYYIVDDNIATVKTLENIVSRRNLGRVAGSSTDPIRAMEEIPRIRPDIVLVDLLMGGLDGITLVSRIREQVPDICFVMISKVTDKSLVQSAYNAGIEFFINKPVNLIEVERVLGNVADRIKMKQMMDNIRSMFDAGGQAGAAAPSDSPAAGTGPDPASEQQAEDADMSLKKMDVLFGTLGMLGERGVQDIRNIIRYMYEHQCVYDKSILTRVAEEEQDTVKNVEQRVRRAIKKGLTNAASAGLDDFGNETFVIYANYVFDFLCLRDEMNYQQGKSSTGGRVSISKFIEGLVLYSRCVD